MTENGRIDKYLWAIRVFKTRSDAAEACKSNKVKIGERSIKPSYVVKVGDIISIRKAASYFTYKVKALLNNRVGAALVHEYAENLTPQHEIDKLKAPKETIFLQRDRGSGRPTKKERRSIDELLNELYE